MKRCCLSAPPYVLSAVVDSDDKKFAVKWWKLENGALILHKQASIRPIHSASLICSARVVVDEYDGTLVPVFALTAQSTAYVTLYTAHTHQFRLSAAGIDVKLEGSIKDAVIVDGPGILVLSTHGDLHRANSDGKPVSILSHNPAIFSILPIEGISGRVLMILRSGWDCTCGERDLKVHPMYLSETVVPKATADEDVNETLHSYLTDLKTPSIGLILDTTVIFNATAIPDVWSDPWSWSLPSPLGYSTSAIAVQMHMSEKPKFFVATTHKQVLAICDTTIMWTAHMREPVDAIIPCNLQGTRSLCIFCSASSSLTLLNPKDGKEIKQLTDVDQLVIGDFSGNGCDSILTWPHAGTVEHAFELSRIANSSEVSESVVFQRLLEDRYQQGLMFLAKSREQLEEKHRLLHTTRQNSTTAPSDGHSHDWTAEPLVTFCTPHKERNETDVSQIESDGTENKSSIGIEGKSLMEGRKSFPTIDVCRARVTRFNAQSARVHLVVRNNGSHCLKNLRISAWCDGMRTETSTKVIDLNSFASANLVLTLNTMNHAVLEDGKNPSYICCCVTEDSCDECTASTFRRLRVPVVVVHDELQEELLIVNDGNASMSPSVLTGLLPTTTMGASIEYCVEGSTVKVTIRASYDRDIISSAQTIGHCLRRVGAGYRLSVSAKESKHLLQRLASCVRREMEQCKEATPDIAPFAETDLALHDLLSRTNIL